MKIVLKLGGSSITKKDVDYFPLKIDEIKKRSNEYIRIPVMKRAGHEIYEALKEKFFQLILINGAGPFGHYLIKNWKLLDNIEIVHESVEYLNNILVSYLKERLDVVACAPFKTCKYVGKGKFDVNELWEFGSQLEEKEILSSYGDIVQAYGIKGRYNGYEVISGDDLSVYLAELCGADKLIMAMEVDGVYDKNPKKYPDAKLIEKIKSDQEVSILTEKGIDVTGGIRGKVRKVQPVARKGIKCQFISGLIEGNIKNALLGRKVRGTLIH